MFFNFSVKCCAVIWIAVICRAANDQPSESIIFPTTFLQRESLKTFDLLSNNAVSSEGVVELSRAAEAFSLEYFQHLSRVEATNNNNVIISPFSIWSLLLFLAEGSSGRTYEQLATTLRLPPDLTRIRTVYKYLQSALSENNTAIELSTNQVLFCDINRPIDIDFQEMLEQIYEADYFPLNFIEQNNAVEKINNYVRENTKGQIDRIIESSDLNAAQMVLVSAIFFQGRWKDPFHIDDTTKQPFYDESGVKVANTPMMFRKGGCSHIHVPVLEADIIELPYGFDQKFSMVIMLPSKNATLIRTIDNLRIFGLYNVIDSLNQSEEDPELEIFLPRFSITSDYKLTSILKELGLHDIFDPQLVNLSKISRHPIHISQFIQKSKIDVNEKGTTAAAASAATLSFQSLPSQFYVNRPFAFMIIERMTNSILFCGHVKNPANV